ncbi:uncharacterized protein [Porites lutea]|uniref:uncharacterized protein n=1 Tax=Porites lutea TaxID=51062 RepID=UPI003CC54453
MTRRIFTKRSMPLALIVICSMWNKSTLSCSCNVASLNELGIEDGHIPDQSMTASSRLDNNHGAGRGRLNQGPTGSQGTAWCAGETDNVQYLQIDLIYTSRVTHVATQGLNDPPKEVNGSNINSWVKEYSLEYSSDGKTYNGYYFDKDLKVFDGNKDGGSISCCELPYPMVVRYVRFKPISWVDNICLRVGIYGIGNVTAHAEITEDEIAIRHYWWWPLMWVLIIVLLIIVIMVCCCYPRIKKKRSLHPRPSRKSEKKRPSFYTNPIAPHSSIRSGQVIIALEELQDGAVPEGNYEEPEDEVQEVVAHFTGDGFSNKHGVTHFSVADEDEDESPAAQPDKDRKRQSQEVPENSQPQLAPIRVYETEPNREDSVGARGKPRRGPSQHIYETVN